MNRMTRFQRPALWLLSLVILGLTSVLALPHTHDSATLQHQAEACRTCKLHEGFTATTGLAQLPVFTAALVLLAQAVPQVFCFVRPVLRSCSSRAPPVLA